jgi:hypothetical protein
MRRLLLTVLLLSAATLAPVLRAGELPPPSPRPIMPDDYTAHPCAPEVCESFIPGNFRDAAYRFLGLTLDGAWFDAHDEEMRRLVKPYCQKRNTCLATPGNSHMFCDDVVAQPIREICDLHFPKDTHPRDWEQCRTWAETWDLGMTQQSIQPWRDAQACTKDKAPGTMHTKPADLWIVPATIDYDYPGFITFYTVDPDTHVPVLEHMTWEGQTIYAPANPTGETASYYPFKAHFKLIRVPNAQGHTDLVPPMVTVKSDYYPTQTFRVPMVLPKVSVEIKPDPRTLRPGTHTVTVSAHDVATGKPVEMRVMLGKDTLGDTNQPLTIVKKKKEKLPEIWATSLFDRYGDVVVVPAEK